MVTRILIMAGGTGGHVFPAMAVAQQLREQGVQVTWMGTRHGLESKVVPEAGFPVEWVLISGLRGKGIISWLLAPFKLLIALTQALVIIMRCRPMVVLGMGGFVSGPGGLMAWLLNKPLAIHEQNAIAGLTNSKLAMFANKVMEAFPGSLPARHHPLLTGNPVRDEIAALAHPDDRLKDRKGPLRLLILGGSLGARALNEIVPQAIKQLPAEQRPRVWHQTGANHSKETYEQYRLLGLVNDEVKIVPFISDMAEAYAWADLVLCRAGALTVSELAAAGVAAILVPYPYAVDDHQSANAAYLVDHGAAIMVQQDELSPDRLVRLLKEFCPVAVEDAKSDGVNMDLFQSRSIDAVAVEKVQARQRLLEMARASRQLAKPDAARQVAQICMEMAYA